MFDTAVWLEVIVLMAIFLTYSYYLTAALRINTIRMTVSRLDLEFDDQVNGDNPNLAMAPFASLHSCENDQKFAATSLDR